MPCSNKKARLLLKEGKRQQEQVANIEAVDEQLIMDIGTKQKAKDISRVSEDGEWI